MSTELLNFCPFSFFIYFVVAVVVVFVVAVALYFRVRLSLCLDKRNAKRKREK
jgi:uncharacterized membrane protein YciS (DUF1049 family)